MFGSAHIGEQGAIAAGVDADATPIDEADLDRGIREAAGSSDDGDGNKGRRGVIDSSGAELTRRSRWAMVLRQE